MASHRLTAIACAILLATVSQSALADSPTSLTSLSENGVRFGTPERGLLLLPQLQVETGATREGAVEGRVRDGQVRRGRLIAVASWDAFGATYAHSFVAEDNPIVALYADWQPLEGVTLRIGQQNAPFSLNDMTSSRYLTFAERSAAWALVPKDAFGFAAGYAADWGTVAGGVYGGNVNTGIDEEGVLAILHGSWAPMNEGSSTLHFGVGLGWRDVSNAPTKPAFAGTAPSALFAGTLTSTGTIENASDVVSANLEAAWVNGPFSLQGEITGVGIARDGASDAFLWGGYGFVTYTLTGERRPYAVEAGDFAGIVPDRPVTEGGPGAWEVGLRLDHLDLSDTFDGGRQTGIGGVLNWYTTDTTRLTLDAARTFIDGGANDGARIDTAVLRFQFTY